MTLQEVSEQCGVPLDVLYDEPKLPESITADMQLRALKEQNETRGMNALTPTAHPS
jgi:hypothetical protein